MEGHFALDLNAMDLVKTRFLAHPPEISEHTFTNLFIWRNSRPIEIADEDGALCIFARRDRGRTLFGPPAGPGSPQELITTARKLAGTDVITFERLPAPFAEAAKSAGMALSGDRANFDYVYCREDLAELPGRRYHAKRNLIAQCLEGRRCEYEGISAKTLPEIREAM